MEQVKVGIIQMYSGYAKVTENVKKAERYIKDAEARGAQLICLPEMFNTGCKFNGASQNLELAETADGPTLTRMREMARKLGVHILSPILVDAGERQFKNTAYLIDDEGELLGEYAKTHPVGEERGLLKRGTEYPVFDTKLGKIGVSICYDACFPETSRILALKGAEILLVPAAWRGSHYFKEWWEINIACRAIDNLVYVAAINACGPTGDGNELYAGMSRVVNPVGQILCAAGQEEEAVLIQDIYPGRVANDRAFNTVLIDRHPEDYQFIYQKI